MELPTDRVDPSVLQFIQDARSYCSFIESLVTARPANCYTILLRVLSNLVASADNLPSETPDADVSGNRRMTHEEWLRLAKEISEALSPEAIRLVECHLADESELGRVTMLWDDLADIYRDLKEGLDLFDLGASAVRATAIWGWRFGYEYHWGSHLIRALSTAHEIRFSLYVE